MSISDDTYKVHPEGFEPPTLGSEDRCSIQLSYGCMMLGRGWTTISDSWFRLLRSVLFIKAASATSAGEP
jgi:hypothetical protein